MISMIAAMTKDHVIGLNNTMPWHLPADLAWFKKNTVDKPIIMGRKTFDSIGKALPQRRNIVLTRNTDQNILGCDVFDSPDAILADTNNAKEIMITGGAQLYQIFLPMADRLYLTFIDAKIQGDTHFPDYTEYQWKESFRETHPADERHAHTFSFVILDRIK